MLFKFGHWYMEGFLIILGIGAIFIAIVFPALAFKGSGSTKWKVINVLIMSMGLVLGSFTAYWANMTGDLTSRLIGDIGMPTVYMFFASAFCIIFNVRRKNKE